MPFASASYISVTRVTHAFSTRRRDHRSPSRHYGDYRCGRPGTKRRVIGQPSAQSAGALDRRAPRALLNPWTRGRTAESIYTAAGDMARCARALSRPLRHLPRPGWPRADGAWCELGANMYPPVPDLTSANVQGRSDGALYCIVQNGVRWTGMPAWKDEHSPEETWRLVSLIRKMPTLKESDMNMERPTAEGTQQSSAVERRQRHRHTR
jgi:hypothetical protein